MKIRLLFIFLLTVSKCISQPKMYPTNFMLAYFHLTSELRFGYEFPLVNKNHTIEPIAYAAIPNFPLKLLNVVGDPSGSRQNKLYFGGGGGIAYRYYINKKSLKAKPFVGLSATAAGYTPVAGMNEFYLIGGSKYKYQPHLLHTSLAFIFGALSKNGIVSLQWEIGTGYKRGWSDFGEYGRIEFPRASKNYYSFYRLPLHIHLTLGVFLIKKQKKKDKQRNL
jgi:hypothetical protein